MNPLDEKRKKRKEGGGREKRRLRLGERKSRKDLRLFDRATLAFQVQVIDFGGMIFFPPQHKTNTRYDAPASPAANWQLQNNSK